MLSWKSTTKEANIYKDIKITGYSKLNMYSEKRTRPQYKIEVLAMYIYNFYV